MGMNIAIVKLEDKSDIHKMEYADVGFDTSRYVGDREFMAQDFEEEIICCPTAYCCGECISRPKDFDKVRKWLKSTRKIPKVCKPRLFKALDILERDTSLYFEYS